MSDPTIVACTADAWTKVASSVIAARVWLMKTTPSLYLHTYVAAGTAAPTDLSEAVATSYSDRDEEHPSVDFQFAEPVDIYYYARGDAGSVRVDIDASPGASPGYSAADQAWSTRELNPLDTRDDGEALIDVTNLADNDLHTVYIPGQHKEHAALQIITSDGTSTDDVELSFAETLERETDPASVSDWTPSSLVWGATQINNATGAINRIDHIDTHVQVTWYRLQYQRVLGSADDADIKANWLDWW